MQLLARIGRRIALSSLALVGLTALTYGMMRVLRPEIYTESLIRGTIDDVRRLLLHLDAGHACGLPGCPPIHDLWREGIVGDLSLLVGGVAIGAVSGVGAGLWCAARPRSAAARGIGTVATVLYCTPVYVIGLSLILLFNPTFGVLWHIPAIFEASPVTYASPLVRPWDWLRSYLIPWLVLGIPIGAACLRLTTALTTEELARDYVRTARGKGLTSARVLRHHAAPPVYASVVAYLWSAIPLIVTNLVLVEFVFAVPGFLEHTKRAVEGQDIALMQALAIWSGVLILVMSIVVDIALYAIDPRLRAADPLGRSVRASRA